MSDNNETKQEKTNVSMQQELELQLHEQYAINNNATLSSMLTLFCTMLAVLWGYGYVLINSSKKYESFYLLRDGGMYTLNALVLATCATTIVLTAISWICIKTGYKGRMEQFIIHAIRLKYYESESNLYKILPNNYNPLKNEEGDKKCLNRILFLKRWIRPIQSPYDTFLYIISIMTLLINICTLFMIPVFSWLLVIPIAVYALFTLFILWRSFKSYSGRHEEYNGREGKTGKYEELKQVPLQ